MQKAFGITITREEMTRMVQDVQTKFASTHRALLDLQLRVEERLRDIEQARACPVHANE